MLPKPGDIVAAGGDLAFRGDSSALVIVHKRGPLILVAEILELRPVKGSPLKPSDTVAKFAERMKAHGVSYLMADGHYRETIDEHLSAAGLAYVSAPNTPVDAYVKARMLFRQGVVRLPNHTRLLQQIREVQGRPLPGGGISVVHPRWKAGGHGDLCAALVLALYQIGADEIPQPRATGSKAWEEEQRELRRKACERAEKDKDLPFWKTRGTRPTGRR